MRKKPELSAGCVGSCGLSLTVQKYAVTLKTTAAQNAKTSVLNNSLSEDYSQTRSNKTGQQVHYIIKWGLPFVMTSNCMCLLHPLLFHLNARMFVTQLPYQMFAVQSSYHASVIF